MSEDTATRPKIRLIIAGGGIAGLALAAALTKDHPNIDYHVFEAIAEYKDVGAGLAFHKNAIAAMNLIGPAVRHAYFSRAMNMGEDMETEVSTEVILAQGANIGTLVAELGKAKGRKTIARAELLKGLLELVPNERVSFGKRMAAIEGGLEEKVKVLFTDGTRAEGDFLIGCDGVHSVTRRFILGPDDPAVDPKNHDGWHVHRTIVSMEEARKFVNPRWMTVVPILLGPRGHINTIPLDKGTRFSAHIAVIGAKKTKEEFSLELDPAWYSDYSEDAQQVMKLVAENPSDSWTPVDHDPAKVYYRGRVAMIGDAAHATLPFVGNGAAQALEDVAVVNHLFSELWSVDDIGHLFRAYDATRRPRSQAVVELGRKSGRIYSYDDADIGDDPLKMKKFFGASAALTNEFDVAKQNHEAMELFKKFKLESSNA